MFSAPEQEGGHPAARRDQVIVGVAALILVASVGQLAWVWAARDRAPPPPQKPAPPAVASIAVLPFDNLSGDPGRRYFSEGVSEQLITELSRRPDLRVSARTSSFSFEGRQDDVKTIARKLGVRAVVDGSVREYGNRVRITAVLINPDDGFQIWTESYDRDLTDILVLQDEIARAITKALIGKLFGKAPVSVPIAAHGPINPEAYRAYLQGQAQLAQRTAATERKAIAFFEKTTALAPDYSDGFAALGWAHTILAINEGYGDQIEPAVAALKRALELDRTNVSALLAHAQLSILRWEWGVAADELTHVKAIHLDTAQAWHARATLYGYMGLPELALDATRRTVKLDPLSYIDKQNVGIYLMASGHPREATEAAKTALKQSPDHPDGLVLLCRSALAVGDVAQARAALEHLARLAGKEPSYHQVACKFRFDIATGNLQEARAVIETLEKQGPQPGVNASDFLTGYQLLGDFKKAAYWGGRAYDLREPWFFAQPYIDDTGMALFQTPEWKALENRPRYRQWKAVRERIKREMAPEG